MSVYLMATLEIKPGEMARFSKVLGEMVPIVESVGWRLATAFTLRTGPLNTVVDLWELPDFNAMNVGMGAIAANKRFPHIAAELQACVIRETLCFADKIDYAP